MCIPKIHENKTSSLIQCRPVHMLPCFPLSQTPIPTIVLYFVKLFLLIKSTTSSRGILLASLIYSIRCSSLIIVVYHQKSERQSNMLKSPKFWPYHGAVHEGVQLKSSQKVANTAHLVASLTPKALFTRRVECVLNTGTDLSQYTVHRYSKYCLSIM